MSKITDQMNAHDPKRRSPSLNAALETPCGGSKAPAGWSCSRELGHEGPCAALPLEPFNRDGSIKGTTILQGRNATVPADSPEVKRNFIGQKGRDLPKAAVPLRPVVTRPVNQDLIHELTDLIEAAERGEITGMAAVFTAVARESLTCIVGDSNTDTFKLLGQVEFLKSRVLARIEVT